MLYSAGTGTGMKTTAPVLVDDEDIGAAAEEDGQSFFLSRRTRTVKWPTKSVPEVHVDGRGFVEDLASDARLASAADKMQHVLTVSCQGLQVGTGGH